MCVCVCVRVCMWIDRKLWRSFVVSLDGAGNWSTRINTEHIQVSGNIPTCLNADANMGCQWPCPRSQCICTKGTPPCVNVIK